jgi:hypothetical protein
MRRVNSGGAHDDHPREAPASHAQTAPSSRIATTIACTPRFQDMHSLPFLWLRGSEYLLVPGAATGALRAFRDSEHTQPPQEHSGAMRVDSARGLQRGVASTRLVYDFPLVERVAS